MSDITQIDLDRALKHLGFDSVADLHYWAKDDGELNRFDALADQLAEHRIAAEKAVLDRLFSFLKSDEIAEAMDCNKVEKYAEHKEFLRWIERKLHEEFADALEDKP